jgi:hypothetical protein
LHFSPDSVTVINREVQICQRCSEYRSNVKGTRTLCTKTCWKKTRWETQTLIGYNITMDRMKTGTEVVNGIKAV